MNRGKTEKVEKRKGKRQKPGRRAEPRVEIVSGVTTESWRERDIRINIDEDCESTIRYSKGEEKGEVEKGVI
jgi:hypothetical protein